jgi:hypothetical protein
MRKIINFKVIFKLILQPILALFCVLAINTSIYASEDNQPIVDLYRSNQITIDDINRKFGKEIKEARDIAKSAGWRDPFSKNSTRLNDLMGKITEGIRVMGNFSYLEISYVLYLDGKVHFTIDIVDKEDEKRLSDFLPKPDKIVKDPDHLIEKWVEYDKAALISTTEDVKLKKDYECPVYHCIWGGFVNPKFKKYEKLFNSLVPKNKERIIEVLRNDKDAEKRAAAAFLLAHIQDGSELVKILIPSIYDSNSGVRNNVMRVLGSTLEKVEVSDFPVDKIIIALDFPSESDRNKALYVLLSLAKQPKYAKYISQHAGKQLIDELKMSQPNLHGNSYAVLTRISGQEYGERDYKAWQDWLSKAVDDGGKYERKLFNPIIKHKQGVIMDSLQGNKDQMNRVEFTIDSQ